MPGRTMAVDVLYLAWNRREFTRASIDALAANTDWSEVETLYVHDDGSSDGTRKLLRLWMLDNPVTCKVVFHDKRMGSPVAVMNWYLDQPGDNDFVKLDSDIVVCPGWLTETLRMGYLNPGYDAIGITPWEGPPRRPPHPKRGILRNSHIGGVGLIRRRMFAQCRPVPRGRFGWTEHQHNHDFQVGWLKPDMPCFELDRLPVEPWVTHATRYVAKGWAREWPKYAAESHAYWDWWTP